ncbi:carbohydrate-binding protein [Nibrella saemangeumensis]|uniref:carbohydrate-binding protein n=1 Tax=Nibrella saemangeumensis TaxID=1084526 RepID=UPI0031E7E1B6
MSNSTGKWLATIVSAGTANITASQAASPSYRAATDVVQAQVVKAAPINGYKPLPGKIEAESYDAIQGVALDGSTDTGGGQYVGWLDPNDWMDYNVTVASTGTYTFRVRVAGQGGRMELRTATGQVIKAVDIPATGGWQTWLTTSIPISLSGGSQTIRIHIVQGGWNLNWFEVATPDSYPEPIQSVITFGALADKTVGDAAFELVATSNNTDTPITFSSSNSGVVSVSNSTGKWMATVVAAGTANITASQAGSTNYKPAADVVRVQTVNPATAYRPLPGKIEAESFDAMQGIAAESTADEGGGQNVGWTDAGDWLDYHVNVASTNNYILRLRVAGFGGQIQFRTANGVVIKTVDLPTTGGWQAWTTINTGISLSAGNQTLRIHISQSGFNLNWFEVVNEGSVQSVIQFGALAERTAGEPPFTLVATSNNTETPITFSSSNQAVVSVANSNGQWRATPLAAGTATITASQAGNATFKAATDVVQTQVVKPAPELIQSVITFNALPEKAAGDPPYALVASSNNPETPITFSSSNPGVVSVSNASGSWIATPVAMGTATITASQAGNGKYRAAADVMQTQVVKAGQAKPIPGRIEAERYDAMQGILTENTGDVAGGGQNVGWTDANDWLDYNVNVAATGTYTLNIRAAGYGGRIEFRTATGEVLKAIDMPITENWQTYTTLTTTISLNAGTQIVRIFSVAGLWNLNWFEIYNPANTPGATQAVISFNALPAKNAGEAAYELTATSTNLEMPITYTSSNPAVVSLSYSGVTWKATPLTAGTAVITASQAGNTKYTAAASIAQTQVVNPNPTSFKPIPGRVEAERYDAMQGITLSPTTDAGGGLLVGWIDPNDWIDYNIEVASAATYTFRMRVAGFGGQIQLRKVSGEVINTIDIPATGGWETWTTFGTPVSLPAGRQILRIHAVSGQWNFNWFEAVTEGTPSANLESVITFNPLPVKTIGDVPFDLTATSTNPETPITYFSSNEGVISVSNSSGNWMATVVGVGTAQITASQAGNIRYKPAADVMQTQVVNNPAPPAGQKIPVSAHRWYQLNSTTNTLAGFFDGNTDVGVQVQGTKVVDNYEAYYPLLDGEEITLSAIKFFDGYGYDPGKPVTLSIIDAQWNRIPVATFTGVTYGWTGPDPNKLTVFDLNTPISGARYLVLNMWNLYPTEIEFYGIYKAPTNPPTPAPAKPVRLKDMFGVNVYEWNFQDGNTPWQINEAKMGVIKNFTGIRHYMDWERIETNEGFYTFNPTQSGGWHYDAIYERCKAEGIEVLADLKTLPGWLLDTYPDGQRNPTGVPVRYGKDYADPRSYIEQAKVGFQYIARYGSNPNVDPSLLKLANGNTLKIGMGVVKYIECDNERDKWWEGRPAYQTAREYAANLSAFYDGHKNSMGPAVGVKNADPSVQVVIAGICTSKDYVKGMIDWCKEHRGYRADGSVNVCWDVINYHYYTFSSVDSRGSAPELSPAGQDAKGYVQVAHEQLRGMPVWITEAGYDVHQGSPLKAIPIGSKSALETQADWILRTALLYARNGIDKLFFYQLYDDNSNSASQYASSGLANEGSFSRRPAADYLYQVNKLFGEYRYQQTLSSDPLVDRYSYNGQSLYVLMIPDEKGRTGEYTLDLGNAASATIYKPKVGSDAMEVQQVQTQGGKLKVAVTETPVFVMSGLPPARVGVAQETSALSTLQVYPNPTVGQVNISFQNDQQTPVQIRVLDAALGRVYRQVSAEKLTPGFNTSIDVSALPTGLYIVEVSQGVHKVFRKIVKVQ